MRNKRKTSILLVEDHAATARAIQRYLESIGYTVHVAPKVSCAREIAAAERINVLVCDINLPDGNGWQLMRELNRDRRLAGLAISGFASQADTERSTAAGFSKHLGKPFSPEELTDAIESLAGGRR